MQESQNISIQASLQTREIGIQVDINGSDRDTVETEEEPDDNLVEFDSKMDDSDIEWSLPNEGDDEEMKPKNVSSISGDTKFIVYKSSLEQLLPSNACSVETPSRTLTLNGVCWALLCTSSPHATDAIAYGNGPFSHLQE